MTAPWYLQPFGVFDLETTGVNAREDRIVTGYMATLFPASAGAQVRIDAKVLLDPKYPIHPKATEKHGISNEHARLYGIDPRDGIWAISIALHRAWSAGFPVVVFNGAFDFSFVHFECLRYDVPTPADQLGRPAGEIGPVIDAHVLDKHVDKYRSGSRTLEATCKHWGVRLDTAHEADSDAMGAGRLAYTLAHRFPREVGAVDLATLHERQRGWRRDQQSSLQRHFRTKGGKPDAVVDPCWPLCIDLTHPTS